MIPLGGEIWLEILLGFLTGVGIGWWIWHNSGADRIQALEAELGASRRIADDAAASRTRVEKELAEANAKISPLLAANTGHAADIERLKKELSVSRSDDASDDAEIGRLRKELEALRAAHANCGAEIDQLKKDLSTSRSDDASDDAEIARLRRELETARAGHASSEAEIGRLRTLVSGHESELLGFRSAAAKQTERLPLFLDAPRGVPDDLRLIKGVGDKLNALLTSIGIFHFRQIAGWSADDIAAVDTKLEIFRGRIVRDEWVEQAKLLARGAHEEFERIYGKMGENN